MCDFFLIYLQGFFFYKKVYKFKKMYKAKPLLLSFMCVFSLPLWTTASFRTAPNTVGFLFAALVHESTDWLPAPLLPFWDSENPRKKGLCKATLSPAPAGMEEDADGD